MLIAYFAEARDLRLADACRLDLTAKAAMVTTASDDVKLKQFSDQHHLTLELLAPTPGALNYRSRAGYRAKTPDLKKCKSIKDGAQAGLIACPPSQFTDHESWYSETQRLAQLGYYVLDQARQYMVVDRGGQFFFSDYDLLGAWDASGRNVYDDGLRHALNQLLGRELVMHGPLAIYHQRAAIGLKLPVRVYSEGQSPVTAYTVPALRALETQHHIGWAWGSLR